MGSRPRENGPPDRCDADRIGSLLEAWQTTADPAAIEALVVAVRPLVEAVAGGVLARCHVSDRSAVEDVVSVVLDHIRRLPHSHEEPRTVTPFRTADSSVDRGIIFVRLLARNRAIDVARSRRRRSDHVRPFSALDEVGRHAVSTANAAAEETDLHDRLVEAVERLEQPLRTVVALLLEGRSQATIAHVLDVCEGTVSRMRQRAVARLRELLDD